MTIIVNFVGGPGAGKSTRSHELMTYYKKKRMNIEYASEYAKDLTWAKRAMALDDQIYVFGKQHHALYTLLNQCDIVVTDSPLILALHYYKENLRKYSNDVGRMRVLKAFENLVLDTASLYNNVNILVERGDRAYVNEGRNQTREEAVIIDSSINDLLYHYKIPFHTITPETEIEEVVMLIESFSW